MNKHGQSIVEYALIAILVILGIVFMGPYVLRSFNAHFKLWDDGVQSSFQEHLTQAPVNDVPPINTNCQCTQVASTSCGGPGLLCPANARELDWNCNIQGCNGSAGIPQCIPDNACCSAWVNTGCGTTPLGVTPTATNGSCNYGYQIQSHLCGSSDAIQCVEDPTCPPPVCTGFILFQNSASYCATGTSTAPTTGLIQDTPNTYVGNSSADCTSASIGGPCQVYCNAPYTVNSTTHPTACILEYTVAPAGTASGCPATLPEGCTSCTAKNSPVVDTVMTCDFQFCVASSSVITSVSQIPYGPTVSATPGIAENNGGCGSPEGEPGQTCALDPHF